MDNPVEFSFKPAPLSGEQIWAIKDSHVLRRGGKRAVDLTKLTSATWGDVAVRGSRMAWFHLKGDGEPLKIACTDSGAGDDRRSFLTFVGSICDVLEAKNQTVEIRVDGGAGYTMAMFMLGVFGAAAGLFFTMAGLFGWVARNELIAIIAGALALMGMGWLAYAYAPWRQVTTVTVNDLKVLAGLLSASDT